MIDNFSLALAHGLMLFAAWRLFFTPELDQEAPPLPDPEPQGWAAPRDA